MFGGPEKKPRGFGEKKDFCIQRNQIWEAEKRFSAPPFFPEMSRLSDDSYHKITDFKVDLFRKPFFLH